MDQPHNRNFPTRICALNEQFNVLIFSSLFFSLKIKTVHLNACGLFLRIFESQD